MADKNSSWFLPALLAIIVLLALGIGLLVFTTNRNAPVITQQTGETPVSPTVTPEPTKPVTLVNQIFLEVTSPLDKSVVATASVVLKGKTVPKAEVSVNDQTLTVDNQGNFSTTINLEEGDNYILVSANDENGQYSEKEILVTYQKAE